MKKQLVILFLLSLTLSSVNAAKSDTLRVLAIGNSFSVDGVEYLERIASAAGKPIIIGNLNIGGCSLERHHKNSLSGAADYSYYKNICGTIRRTKAALITGITDEKWDIITLQQVSHQSGIYDSYYPFITELVKFVSQHASNPKMKLALHQTWAYAATSTHKGFANYDRDQAKMYRQIVETYKRIAKEQKIKIIIPSGTAIQNGRSSRIGDEFCRDGYHLNNLGRYTAGCTWFEKLFGKSAVGNSFCPDKVTKEDAEIAQKAAHAAVKRPDAVTRILK